MAGSCPMQSIPGHDPELTVATGSYGDAGLYTNRVKLPSEAADHEHTAAPRIIQSVSSLVVSSKAKLTAAIAIVTAPVSASRASGIAAASSRPALAITTVCKMDLIRGCSILRPTKWTNGI